MTRKRIILATPTPSRPASLRARAEAAVRASRTDIALMAPEQTQRLVHELQVHQIELEMQNEELRRAQGELVESSDRFTDLYDFAPVGYVTIGDAGIVLEANLTLATMLGVERGRLVGRAFARFVLRDAWDTLALHHRAVLEGAGKQACDLGLRRGDGTTVAVRLETTCLRDALSGTCRYRSAIVDITERLRVEGERQAVLREGEERWRLALDAAGLGAWDMSLVDHTAWRSPRHDQMFGHDALLPLWTFEMFLGYVLAEDRAEVARSFERAVAHKLDWSVECRIGRTDGAVRWICARGKSTSDARGRPVRMFGSIDDITERKAGEHELERQALHDVLTGLPNRQLLHDRMASALVIATRNTQMCALLLLDLDHFKEVNDTLGHAAGDLLLQQIGPRLRTCLRDSDTIARLGGDEFAVVLHDANPTQAEHVATKLLSALRVPFDIGDGVVADVGASVGIAVSPLHAQTAESLLRCADVALYRAKRNHGSHETYAVDHDPHSGPRSGARLAFFGEVRDALESRTFALHYQPKVRLSDRALVGVEALARWPHPSRGWIPPADFIPELERHGLIGSFTQWAIEAAARQAASWRAAGRRTPVAVNISPVALRNRDFSRDVLAIVDRVGGSGDWLELEVTENTLMDHPRVILERLSALRARGVRVSIDDFGTGYSSLTYLLEFGADTLKIDQTFVDHMMVDTRHAAIVGAVITLGHALGMTVVAEGVEDDATCERLVTLGCDQAQGYYVAKPMPADALEAWLCAHVGGTVGPGSPFETGHDVEV